MSLQFDLLTHVPDFLRPPNRTTSTTHHRTGLSTARETMAFPQRTPDILFSYRYSFTERLALQQFKEFFRDKGGRTWAFFIPSWRRDITLIDPVLAGEKQIEISSPDEDYEARHLTDTDPEHFGRFLFFWKDGEDPWATDVIRVLPGTADGQEILDLDLELPWDIDDRTVIGWCHLVRFMDDQIQWQHWSPDHAETEIGFRATRRANQNTITQPITQVDQYGQLGFTTCTLAPGEVLPVTNRVGYGLGPDTLHNTQDDPYRINWAVYTATDGSVRIRKAIPPANEVIWLPQVAGTESILFTGEEKTSDHWSLAFDQNAYEVIAYQSDTDEIECRRFFNTEVVTVTWEGRDPALQYNALLDANLETGETDVICYYLKKDDNALYMRVQRDDFEIEYTVALLPSRPIALKRAYFEYDETEAAGVLKVEYLDAGMRVCTLSSAQYEDPPPPPVPPYVLIAEADSGSATGALVSGDYSYAVIWADGGGEFDPHPAFEDGGTATASLHGDYESLVIYADGNDTDLGPHDAFADFGDATASMTGAYTLSVVTVEDDLAETGTAGRVTISGTYAENVIFPPITDEQAEVSAQVTGVYEPA